MPQNINIVVWNVRDMGQYVQSIAELQSACVATFIASFIETMKVDVLVIQELKASGIPMLLNIVAALNTGPAEDESFVCDFVPVLSKNDSTSLIGKIIQGRVAEATDMITKYTCEAYGLIGRKKYIQAQEGPSSLSPQKMIELCWQSYCPVIVNKDAGPSFIPNPKETGTPQPLNFVTTSSCTIAQAKGQIRKEKAGDMLSLDEAAKAVKLCTDSGARRPCKVSLAVDGVSITLLTYHGISAINDPTNVKACYGASLATLLDEINNPTSCPNVVLAGDFNIVKPVDIAREFSGEFFAKWYTAQTIASKEYCGTKVNVHHGQYSNPTPLDLMFTSFTEGQVTAKRGNAVLNVPNLLGESSGFLRVLGRSVLASRQWQNLVTKVFEQVAAKNTDFNFFSCSINSAGFVAGPPKLNVGEMLRKIFATDARPTDDFNALTAALFYYMFISDHLPLMISLEVGGE